MALSTPRRMSTQQRNGPTLDSRTTLYRYFNINETLRRARTLDHLDLPTGAHTPESGPANTALRAESRRKTANFRRPTLALSPSGTLEDAYESLYLTFRNILSPNFRYRSTGTRATPSGGGELDVAAVNGVLYPAPGRGSFRSLAETSSGQSSVRDKRSVRMREVGGFAQSSDPEALGEGPARSFSSFKVGNGGEPLVRGKDDSRFRKDAGLLAAG